MRLIRLSDLQEIIKLAEGHLVEVITALGFQAIPSDETFTLVLVITSQVYRWHQP